MLLLSPPTVGRRRCSLLPKAGGSLFLDAKLHGIMWVPVFVKPDARSKLAFTGASVERQTSGRFII